MAIEEITKIIGESLTKMGCSDVLFSTQKDDVVVVIFNCKDLTSFKTDLPGWTYSGIELDPTKERQYKITFIRKY